MSDNMINPYQNAQLLSRAISMKRNTQTPVAQPAQQKDLNIDKTLASMLNPKPNDKAVTVNGGTAIPGNIILDPASNNISSIA